MRLASATRFLNAFRAGATAAEMDVLLAEVRRDEAICRDMRKLADLTRDPGPGADEAAALLARARYLMEMA